MNAIRGVVFDCVGTLLHPHPPVDEVYKEAGLRGGVVAPRAVVLMRRRNQLRLEEDAHRRSGDSLARSPTSPERERQRWRNVVCAVFPEILDEIEPVFERLWRHFAQPEHWRLAPGAAEVIEHLHRRGIVTAVASNFDERLRSVCAGHPPLAASMAIFSSAELGWSKPSPEFFAAVTEQLDLPPESLLMVGDDLTNDGLGPRAAGWRSVLVASGENSEGIPILRDLRELPGFLG
mgnify:CR=1 FL=1